MSKINPTLDRAIITYLHPKYHCLFIAECFSNAAGKSETGQKIIKKHFDCMSEKDKESLRKLYNEMTPDQRKRPNKPNEED